MSDPTPEEQEQALALVRSCEAEVYCRHGKRHQMIRNCEACEAKVYATALAEQREPLEREIERQRKVIAAVNKTNATLGCQVKSRAKQRDLYRERYEQAESRTRALEGALERIDTWAKAYPLDIFPEPDFKKAAALLKAGGMTIDAISASNMRHVIEGVGGIVRTALHQDAEGATKEEHIQVGSCSHDRPTIGCPCCGGDTARPEGASEVKWDPSIRQGD